MKLTSIAKTVEIDLYSPTSYEIVKAQQGDKDSRSIEFILFDKGQPYDFPDNVIFGFTGHRGDGSSFLKMEDTHDCIVRKDNHVIVTLPGDVLYYPGIIEAKLVMYETSKKAWNESEERAVLSTVPFKIACVKSPYDENELSDGERSIITDLIFKVDKFSESATKIISQAQDFADAASNSASNAANSANAASNSASNAASSANAASNSASNAASSANAASNSATRAANSANAANNSATNAANSATLSQSYAIGGTGTRSGENTDNAMAYSQKAKEYADSWKGSLLPQGSVTFSQLPTSGNVKGHMYNVNEAFVTDSRFKEGAGYSYPAGTNVYWTSDGKWKCLSGVLTKVVTQAEYNALPETEKMSGTIYYISDADNELKMATHEVPGVVVVDRALSSASVNPVQNMAVTNAINGKLGKTENAVSASKWNNARNINGMNIDGSANRMNYAICSTSGSSAEKTVSCTGFSLVTGAEIIVKFTYANTASNPSLNINGTGAKPIYYKNSAIPAECIGENSVRAFRYSGTRWEAIGDLGVSRNTSWFGACGSQKNETTKIIDMPGFELREFVRVSVYFTFGNTAENITMNINGTGAKAVLYKDSPVPANLIQEKWACEFVYYAGAWRIIGDLAEKKASRLEERLDSLTASNIGALPSSGGTVSGSLTVTGETTLQGNVRIKKSSSNYGSVINIGDGDYIRISEETDDILTVKAKQININSSNANAVYINGQMALRYKKLTQSEYDALSSAKNSDNVLYFITN